MVPTLWNWFVAVDMQTVQTKSLPWSTESVAQWKLVPVQPINLQTNDGKGQHLPVFPRYRYWVQVCSRLSFLNPVVKDVVCHC